jgi:hypothetical protein
MTRRENKLAKSLLDILHDRDGRPHVEPELLAELVVFAQCSLSEAKATLKQCDARGWLTGVDGKFSGKIWAINDEGEIARLQL